MIKQFPIKVILPGFFSGIEQIDSTDHVGLDEFQWIGDGAVYVGFGRQVDDTREIMAAKKIIDKLVKEGKLSTEEGKKVIDDLVEKGKLSAEEGKKTIEDFIKNAKTKSSEVETQVKGIVERILSSFDYATTKELEDLKKRVAMLESKLKSSSKPVTKATPKAKKAKAVPA